MSSVAGPDIVDQGVDLILDINNSRSYPGTGTTITDIVGNRTATIESAQPVNLNSRNPAVGFSGGGQKVSMGYSGTGVLGSDQDVNTVTVEVLFQITAVDQFQNLIQIGTASDGLSVGITDNNVIRFVVRKGGTGLGSATDSYVETNRVLETGVWYHVVCVLSDTQQSVYVNSEKLATQSVNNFVWNTGSTGGVQIGAVTTQSGLQGLTDSTETFNGEISTVRIYNRVLDDSEIFGNFHAFQNRFRINYDILDSAIVTNTTYALSPSSVSINEGVTQSISVNTTGVADGTTLYWTIDGTDADFNSVSGTVVVNSNTGSFDVITLADSTTEGTETYTVSLRTDSITGTVVASSTLTVLDSSTTPAAYSFDPADFLFDANTLGTLYQDPLGNTAVSASGDSVAKMQDSAA